MPYRFSPKSFAYRDRKMKPAHQSSRAGFLRALRRRRNPSVVITAIALTLSIIAVSIIAGVISVLVVPS